MLGKVALEEAYEYSGLAEKSMRDSSLYIAPWDLVSLTVPGILGIADKTEAEKTANLMNNWIAEHIKEHRDRLGAFACLSMHDPVQAGQELRRCIRKLGFLCCVISNMPVRMAKHTSSTTNLSTMPFGRSSRNVEKSIAEGKGKVMCKKTVYDYFKRHFSTVTLKYVMDEIVADRVLFSIDYPYEMTKNGCGWWDNGAKAIQEAVGGVDLYRWIGRDNAKKLLELSDFHDSEAPVNWSPLAISGFSEVVRLNVIICKHGNYLVLSTQNPFKYGHFDDILNNQAKD
ncbi:hypothetical protein CNMCM7927_002536 [Aspergillus lentulus]|nr:hypothetical protein CNMCM7927_002536 [Aspergillus lentulus]